MVGPARRTLKRFRRSRSGRDQRFPLATIAAYGRDSSLATKLVVGVIERPGQRDPSVMRTWTSETVDVRHDLAIAADIASFTQQHGVKETITADRVIGCPHEEGVDYPMGRTCPRCPFWADIDRFTHEPVTRPEPTMAPAEILADLAGGPEPPYDALEAADAHREVLVEPLLRAIETGLGNPSGASPEEARVFSYALYLFARWREVRAYPYVIRWLSLPGEAPFDIAGDIVTRDGGRILAAVCDGNLEPITTLAADRRANEYARAAAVTALTLLTAWAEVPGESVITVLLWLARDGLEREPSQVWNSLAIASADIEALPLFPELRRAYDDGLIELRAMHPSELDEVEAAPRGRTLEQTRERFPPVDDVAEATAWWAGNDALEAADVTPEPYRAPPKVGRNEPCPCGSGKKFKKCCGG
jgi:hypothetical protein